MGCRGQNPPHVYHDTHAAERKTLLLRKIDKVAFGSPTMRNDVGIGRSMKANTIVPP